MKILHVARECAPLAKAGGLADVVGALPPAAARVSPDARSSVLLPAYESLAHLPREPVLTGSVRVGDERLDYRVVLADASSPRVPIFLVEHETFAGPAPYGGDELRREAVLSAAGLDLATRFDVLHVHDHHAALACTGLATHPAPPPLVLTVHNARYHGTLDWSEVDQLDLPAGLDRGLCDHEGRFNRLKAAALHARVVSTVSPTHAHDLLESAEASAGLDYAFRDVRERLVGILNGIDQDTWNPATDELLEHRYSRGDLAGKVRQKQSLCAEFGLDPAAPLLGFIGRLVPEKGIDALLDGIPALLARDSSVHVLLLGTGEPRYESALLALATRHAPRVALAVAQDERLAHRLYAAADVLLMPSWYEPCGLSQMYALRYGTIPLVHPTGGLRDSVVPFDPVTGEGNGAWMPATDGPALADTAMRVLAWMRGPSWALLRDNAMVADHGWSASAARHVATWRRALEDR